MLALKEKSLKRYLTSQGLNGIIKIRKEKEGIKKMTVRELREILAQFDENMEVQIKDGDWEVPIQNVDIYNGFVLIENLD